MRPLEVVGIDPALSVTGVASAGTVTTIRPRRSDVAYERHWRVATEVLTFALHSRAHLAVVEDYAPHGIGINSTLVAGEVGGLVRTLLTVRAVPFALVRPNTLKLYATGKGNADKAAMVDAATARLGERFPREAKVDDLADALWLRDLGAWLYRLPSVGPHPDGAARLDLEVFARWPTPAQLREAELERVEVGRASIESLTTRTV